MININNQKIRMYKRVIFRERGVGLIEVLIAMLIFGTALVTLSGLQTKSLQFNQSAYLRSQASMLAYDIIDRIRINRTDASNYSIDFGAAVPAGASLRQQDLSYWLNAVAASLPEGQGEINCDAENCTVQIRWTEQAESANTDNTSVPSFIYSSKI
jgi:type IV pilus assembly protein PilV